MKTETPLTIYLRDYRPADFLVDRIDLTFDIFDTHTDVSARMVMQRNPAANTPNAPLVLVGDELTLTGIKLDGEALAADRYVATPDSLTVPSVPDSFFLDVCTRIDPGKNTALSGLYASGGNLYTQCEAEGFRRILYYLDRPDVMTRFTTTIIADKHKLPVLLSNGNKVGEGDSGRGRHWVKWVDPFRKPSYLFALVAGRLSKAEDLFVTRSGREVRLEIWTEAGNLDKVAHAMNSVKHAMKWDEDRFGLEYDLDIYMIVAVGDFNMGAMENKGLNIFNTKYVLARPDTATDVDFSNIQAVIGHEYFHNWTGNRVTCRDWFQLSLKEGLTVFRDQEFSMDLESRAVERIDQVRTLRTVQFPEDAGPMAHPVRPQSYMEINNFYTVTVYEKGAEVIRMQHTLLGEENFQKGMALYFQRHDGQAVTTDDFVAAMADASGQDLSQFKLWYDQAGTPLLQVSDHYDADSKRYTLTFRQSCPPTPDQPEKRPFHIPVKLGLLDAAGNDLTLNLEGGGLEPCTSCVLSVKQAEQSFTFTDVPVKPVPSLLRGFSAPVRLDYAYTDEQLTFLLAHDSDEFNRWDAGQKLAERTLLKLISDVQGHHSLHVPDSFIEAFRAVLNHSTLDPALAAQALSMPSELWLAEQMTVADPDAIFTAREWLVRTLAQRLHADWAHHYERLEQDRYEWSGPAAAKRALRNTCLAYLTAQGDEAALHHAYRQYKAANNMTDQLAALSALNRHDHSLRTFALTTFAEQWQGEPLVMDKWFALQAVAPVSDALTQIEVLTKHPAFSYTNPNKVYALLRTFGAANPKHFHAADGSGYRFMSEQVLTVDKLNPQVAARLAGTFNRWRKYDAGRQAHARAELERIAGTEGLSRDVYEIVSKALAG